MAVRDKVVGWFIQHYIIPRSQIIDQPGFVIFNVSYKTDIYSRQIVIPESLFVSIEKETVKKYKDKGKQVLYSIGKKFGYRFASMTNAIKLKETNEKSFLDYVNILSKFVEGTYASNISTTVNLKKLMIDFKLDNFVICRKSGLGYLISLGGIPGIWSYMLDDVTIEGVQPECQGKGNKKCRVISAPVKFLRKEGYKPFREIKLKGLEMENDYKNFNNVRDIEYSNNSLKNLIDFGFFKFRRGILSYNNDRYFIVESSFPYIIETEFEKLKNGEKLLFNLSFEYGKRLTKEAGKEEPCKFLMDFMPALGWGDILAREENRKYNVYIKYFPWTKWYSSVKFVIFSGIISGIFSGFLKRNIIFKVIKRDISQGFLELTLKEI